jgi:hypothetical protein
VSAAISRIIPRLIGSQPCDGITREEESFIPADKEKEKSKFMEFIIFHCDVRYRTSFEIAFWQDLPVYST